MVELFCALVGVKGSAFSVEIETNQSVAKLKDAIKKKNKKRIECDAAELQLYLAKKGNAWLTENEVKEGVDDTNGFEPLDVVGAPLNLVGLSEEDIRFQVTKEDVKAKKIPVHVLVVIPESATSEAVEQKPLTLEMLQDFMDQRDKKKRKCVAMSSVSTWFADTLKSQLPMETVIGDEPKVRKNQAIPGFKWDTNRHEDQQVQECSAYLQSHLHVVLQERRLRLFDASAHRKLLDVRDDRFGCDFSGTTDLVVLKDLGDDMETELHHCEGLRLLIELKTDMKRDLAKKESQALAELIAANVKVPHMSPIVLLTDLQQQWRFMWLSEGKTIRRLVLKQPANAFRFIRRILQQNDGDMTIHNPLTHSHRFPDRGNINKLFPPGDSGIGEMIERCQSIGSESFFDWSMELEIGRKVVQGMPAYASMLREKPKASLVPENCAHMYG